MIPKREVLSIAAERGLRPEGWRRTMFLDGC